MRTLHGYFLFFFLLYIIIRKCVCGVRRYSNVDGYWRWVGLHNVDTGTIFVPMLYTLTAFEVRLGEPFYSILSMICSSLFNTLINIFSILILAATARNQRL
mgnify:CR=1 FL=1